MSKLKIEMDIDTYIGMLENRRVQCRECFGWTIEDWAWELAMDLIREIGPGEDADPKSVVDNLLVNAQIVPREEFSEDGEYAYFYKDYEGDWDAFCKDCLTSCEKGAIEMW